MNSFIISGWTISVFGTQFENVHGQGTCYSLWQTAKTYGAYKDKNDQFRGVGYSINTDNVISGEWTLGAINACRVMHDDIYKDDGEKKTIISERYC